VGQSRLVDYRNRVQDTLRTAFGGEHPPRLTAASFSLGLFLIALPNLGASVVVLAGIGYRYEWANPSALVAAVVILNPVVKGFVYVGSFTLGTMLLGPADVASEDASLSAGWDVVARLLVGNLLVAAAVAAAGYAVALYGISAVRQYR